MRRERPWSALAEAVRRSGLIEPVSSGVVMVSGGRRLGLRRRRRWPGRSGRRTSTRCTSTTGSGTPPAATSGSHATSARCCGSTSTSSARALAPGQPPGRRAGLPLRGRRAAPRPRRRRLDRHRPHAGPTSPRRWSTASPSRPGRERSAACRRRAGGWSARCSDSERAELRRLATAAGLPFADDETNLDPRVRAQPDPRRGPAGASRPERRRRAEHRRDPGRARRGGSSCSNGSCSRRSRPRERAPARSRSGRRRWPARSRRSGGWPCAPSPSEPRAARCRSGAGGLPRSCAWPIDAGGRRGRPRRRRARDLRARADPLRDLACEADAAPAPAPLRVPGELPLRAVGGPRRASRRAGRARRAPTWRPSTRRRSATSWWSAPGARATGCGHSAWTAPRRLQDLFTDRGVPRSLRHRLPVVTAAGRVVWVAGVAVSEDFRLAPEAREVAVLTARVLD